MESEGCGALDVARVEPISGRSSRLACIACATLACATGAVAGAAPPPTVVNPLIDQAQKQMDAADFEAAARTLNGALADPDNTTEALVVIYRMLGNCYLYLDDQSKAREAFERLLQVQPDYELPATAPPKLREIYRRLKDDIRRGRVKPVRLTHEPITSVPPDQPVVVAAEIQDLPLGAKARVYYRRAGTESYSSVDMKRAPRSDRFAGTIPAYEFPPGAGPLAMEYYVEVTDAAQRRVAGRGDALEPLAFQVSAGPEQAPPVAEAQGSVLTRPTLWAIVGGVLLLGAATAGTVYLLTNQQNSGTVTITVRAQ